MKTIPLKNLIVSEKYNVRKTHADKGLEELVASIKAHGLLENLVVVKGDNDNFEVIAGGRRLRALNILHKQKQLNNLKIACEVVEHANAEEISLAENMVRTRMHPADEFEAWAKLVDDGLNVTDIAARFGVTNKVVLQRLKLGKVAKEILAAYKDNKITLEALMAYTVSDIHARQIEVFHQLQDKLNCNNANAIKNSLIITQYDASHKYAKFIGLDAYEDAGGEVIKDLFAEEEKDIYLCNDALVEKLVDEKLNEEIAKLSDKWKWVESRLELDWDERYSFKHLSRQKLEEIPHDLILKKEELEEKVNILQDEEEYDQNVVDKLQAQLDDYDAKIKAYYGFVETEMANAGCIITISYDGELEILEGLIKPEDFKKQNTDSGNSDTVKVKPLYSKPLTQRLENYRLHSIKMDLANDYEASFDIALFNMCIDIFGKYERKCLDLSASEYYYPFALKDDDKTCNDMQTVEDKFYKKLPLDWMQEDSTTDKFNTMCKLSIEEKQNLFSSCVSKTLKPQLANDKSGSEMFEVIGERLSVDVARDFTPTATNYFKHISKGELLRQGNELLGEKWMNLHIKKTKSELVNILDKIFTKPKHHKLASDVLEKVKTWLPKNMSF